MAAAVRIVLLRPRHPGNVGAAARAMKNFGFRNLELVADADPRGSVEAVRLAHGAEDVLAAARLHRGLGPALEETALVIGTSGRRGRRWQDAPDPEELGRLLLRTWDWRPTAVVFGPEDRGLTLEEVAGCAWVVRIPTHHDCPSMNLSHAVAVFCYGLTRAVRREAGAGRRALARPEELRTYVEAMGALLGSAGFLGGDAGRDAEAVRRLQGCLLRAAPDKTDLALLWRLLRHLEGRRKA